MVSRKRTVEIEVVADTAQAERSLKRVGGESQTLGGRFKSASNLIQLAMAGTAVTAVATFADRTIRAFSNLEQSVGGTEAVFGDASGAIDEFAKRSADAVGLSEAEFRTATTRIGGQLKRMTGDVEFAAEKSIVLTQAAADLAATFGGTTAEAVDALGAAMRGEADPAERFNLDLKVSRVNAKAVELGLAETTRKVDDNAKAQAILALVLEQGSDAMGQFAREADTVSGKLQRSQAAAEDAAASFGRFFVPIKLEASEVASNIATIGDAIGRLGGEGKGLAEVVDTYVRWTPILGDVVRALEGVADAVDGTDEKQVVLSEHTEESIGATNRHRGAQEDLRAALQESKEAHEDAVPSAAALAFEMEREADAARAARDALQEQRDALREIHSPLSRAFRATQEAAEAQKDLDKATRKYGDDSDEAVDAALRLGEANAELEGILRDLKSQGIDPTGAAARQMLEGIGIPRPVIDRLFATFDEIEANWENRRFATTVTMPALPRAGARSTGPGAGIRSHSGEIVQGTPGSEHLRIVQAGEEIVRRAEVGARHGGGTVINNVHLSNPSPLMIAEMLELRRRGRR